MSDTSWPRPFRSLIFDTRYSLYHSFVKKTQSHFPKAFIFYRAMWRLFFFLGGGGVFSWQCLWVLLVSYIAIPANTVETSRVIKANPLCATADTLLSLISESDALLPLYVTPHSWWIASM